MFKIAVLTGLYSYSVFILGITGLLNKSFLSIDTIFFLLFSFFLLRDLNLTGILYTMENWIAQRSTFEKFILIFIVLQVAVNIVGVLGPELSFDALWYHLTLPKIFLAEGRIFHIPGGILYYSDMPKLLEMLYIPALAFGNETVAKFIHFFFGVLSAFALYRLSRLFLNEKYSLISVLVFYSNLVVGWQSTTAYVDLGRTFFVILALFFLMLFYRKKQERLLWFSAVVSGLAISTKVLSASDLLIITPLLFMIKIPLKNVFKYFLITISIPLPWFIFAYVNTGNPVYPFFSEIYRISAHMNPLTSILNFLHSPDPISPIYLIVLPVLFFKFRKFTYSEKLVFFYCLGAFLIWTVIPQTGGGRFIMAYLPALSVLTVLCLKYLNINYLKKYILFIIILLALSSLIYRAVANFKFIPVILGNETKQK